MKKKLLNIVLAIAVALPMASCRSNIVAGAGGYDTGTGVSIRTRSLNDYDLVPSGPRITFTIDISTPEGAQKLQNISLDGAKRLAETEACRKYDCDRLIDPRFDYLAKDGRILRVTVDGRPGIYKLKE